MEIKEQEKNFVIIRIDAGTIHGVNIPFVLVLPTKLKGKNKLIVAFNNEGGISLDESVQNIESEIPMLIKAIQLDMPAIVPILPSKKEFDRTLESEDIDLKVGEPKQFARECFDPRIMTDSRFYRIDEQVKTMLKAITGDKALIAKILKQSGRSGSFEFEDKMIGLGHSGAGAAMLRFSLIHPELFDTLIIGGNGDIIPTPLGENGKKLAYPFGIQDYFELFGREFSEDDYRSINLQFYIGDKEDSKKVYDTIRDENYTPNGSGPMFAPEDLAIIYKKLYGLQFFERFKNALMQLENAGVNVGLKIYPNDCHSMIKPEDFHGIVEDGNLFDGHCAEQIQKMMDNRLLVGSISATEENTRIGEFERQAQTIKAGQKTAEQEK